MICCKSRNSDCHPLKEHHWFNGYYANWIKKCIQKSLIQIIHDCFQRWLTIFFSILKLVSVIKLRQENLSKYSKIECCTIALYLYLFCGKINMIMWCLCNFILYISQKKVKKNKWQYVNPGWIIWSPLKCFDSLSAVGGAQCARTF